MKTSFIKVQILDDVWWGNTIVGKGTSRHDLGVVCPANSGSVTEGNKVWDMINPNGSETMRLQDS